MGFQIAHYCYFTFLCTPVATQALAYYVVLFVFDILTHFLTIYQKKNTSNEKIWGPFYFVFITVLHGKERSNLNRSLKQKILKEG